MNDGTEPSNKQSKRSFRSGRGAHATGTEWPAGRLLGYSTGWRVPAPNPSPIRPLTPAPPAGVFFCRAGTAAEHIDRSVQARAAFAPGGFQTWPLKTRRAAAAAISGGLGELLWAVGYTVLEIIPLSRFATSTLRRVDLDRQGTTGLGKFRTVRSC